MIHVFTENSTPRLVYVLNFCFKDKDQPYQICTNRDEWAKLSGPKLNYSDLDLRADWQIMPSLLLQETSVRNDEVIDAEGKIDGVNDSLALIFFLISRYEEYASAETDQHGRFVSAQSWTVRTGNNKRPLADELVKKIWDKCRLDYAQVLDRFECVPSFDIDIAWAYGHRKFPRNFGAFLKGGDKTNRIKVAMGKEKDPYDTYSYIMEVSSRVDRIICFALLGDYGKYDKNIHWTNEHLQSLIRGLNSSGGMGIHPSYNSFLNAARIEVERKRLEEIVGHEIVKSRQHFLRLKLPESYRVLLDAGITKDYSMGFADNVGFRAGTSFPYFFFDLEENLQTPLLIFPFAYMDNSLKDYLNLDVDAATHVVEELVDNVRAVGGLFMCIWHNSSINDRGEWEGWKAVLDHTINYSRR